MLIGLAVSTSNCAAPYIVCHPIKHTKMLSCFGAQKEDCFTAQEEGSQTKTKSDAREAFTGKVVKTVALQIPLASNRASYSFHLFTKTIEC